MAGDPAYADAVEFDDALMQLLYRAPIGIVQASTDGAVEMLNPMAAQLLMPLCPDGRLNNLFDVLDAVAPQLRGQVAAFEAPGGMLCEGLRFAPAAPPGVAAQIIGLSLLKLDPARIMMTLTDVTADVEREQRELDRQRLDAARTDSLTRMPNRLALRDHLGQLLDGDVACAVLLLNYDRFKQVNDTLGHAAGDVLLGLIGERLLAALRHHPRGASARVDAPMVGRVGGDEFAVILSDATRADEVHAVARRLVDVLAQPYSVGDELWQCGVSMGVVLPSLLSGDADAVLQDATIAMVEAKRGGGGRYVAFEPAMRERASRRASTEGALRRALAEGELYVVYQPVVGLAGGPVIDRAAGVEALVRWQHPTRGVVQPLDFIDVAEECGLIGRLGDFVLATACRDFARWQSELGDAAPCTLAVNLSRAQLADERWVARVQAILLATGVRPEQLQLEVTESLAAQDDVVQARLHELKRLGVMLALDDFGTGYSSLASLHLLPVDTVKIDRSFVSRVDTSSHHRVLVEATVRVANSLGMRTVAEGIETEAQAAVIRELGCDRGQGYLYSRPLTAEDAARWFGATPSLAPRATPSLSPAGACSVDRVASGR